MRCIRSPPSPQRGHFSPLGIHTHAPVASWCGIASDTPNRWGVLLVLTEIREGWRSQSKQRQTCSFRLPSLPPAQTRRSPRLCQHGRQGKGGCAPGSIPAPASQPRGHSQRGGSCSPRPPPHGESSSEPATSLATCLCEQHGSSSLLLGGHPCSDGPDLLSSANQGGQPGYGPDIKGRPVTALCQKAELVFGCGLVFIFCCLSHLHSPFRQEKCT